MGLAQVTRERLAWGTRASALRGTVRRPQALISAGGGQEMAVAIAWRLWTGFGRCRLFVSALSLRGEAQRVCESWTERWKR